MTTRRMTTPGAAFGAALLVLAASGCRESGQPSDDHPTTGAHPATGAADLDDVPVEAIRKAMPKKTDFPDGWQPQTQTGPPAALSGISGTNTQVSSVEPNQCLDFAAEFISAPGSSIPGEFVSGVIAPVPAPGSGTVTIIAARKTRGWESPSSVRDSLRDCSDITADLSIGGKSNPATFASAPIDTSAIKAEAAGRTTIIHAGDEATSFVVVRARVRGVLVAASAHTNPAAREDQQALLVKLVGETVGKLNAL